MSIKDFYADFEPDEQPDPQCRPSLRGELGDPETVDVRIDAITRETEKAFLCYVGGWKYWLPKKGIIEPERYYKGLRHIEMEVCLWAVKLCQLTDYL